MEYTKTCAHCGRTFISTKANAKYCCDSCRTSAFKSKARQGARAESEREKEQADDAFRKENAARRKRQEQERQERAAAGDPLQQLMLAEKFSLEYWTAYQEYLLQIEPDSHATVNGIPVTDPDFPALVTAAIEEMGIIQTKEGGIICTPYNARSAGRSSKRISRTGNIAGRSAGLKPKADSKRRTMNAI